MQLNEAISSVLNLTKQETETQVTWAWVEASVWTTPMLTALVNGVKGGKWFSLMNKVYASATLEAAWQQVRKHKGSHGIDGMSLERFASQEGHYLLELQRALKEGSYQPLPVKRVVIPKPDKPEPRRQRILGQKKILGCTGKFGRSTDSRPPECSCFGRFK